MFSFFKLPSLLLIVILTSCSFQSSQWNTVKGLVAAIRQPALANDDSALWNGTTEDRDMLFLVEKKAEGVRFTSQEGIEIDFDMNQFSIVAVRNWSTYQDFISVQSEDGLSKTYFRNGQQIGQLQCQPYQVKAPLIYARQCIDTFNDWRYADVITLNEDKLIVGIQTAISPDEPIINLVWSLAELTSK